MCVPCACVCVVEGQPYSAIHRTHDTHRQRTTTQTKGLLHEHTHDMDVSRHALCIRVLVC